jgi:hypothetical protein
MPMSMMILLAEYAISWMGRGLWDEWEWGDKL